MGKRPKRAGIYARVSTLNGQTPENQLRELREVTKNARWKVIGEFVDRGISGAKGRDKRPAFDDLLKKVARREVDVVMAWSVDRLGRSPQHLVQFLGVNRRWNGTLTPASGMSLHAPHTPYQRMVGAAGRG